MTNACEDFKRKVILYIAVSLDGYIADSDGKVGWLGGENPGKVFVAVGILQLIEKGALRLEDTLGDVLDIDMHEIDPKVTVGQLLMHTSGVPDYFDESVMDEYEELWVDFPNYKIKHASADIGQIPYHLFFQESSPEEHSPYCYTGIALLSGTSSAYR